MHGEESERHTGHRVALLLESDGPGGAERMLLQLADGLLRKGHEVVPVGPASGSGWLAAQFHSRGFRTWTFSLARPLDPGCALSLASLLRRLGVTVAHSHEFTMGVYGAAASSLAGVPHVMTMHGGQGYANRWRRRMALRWASNRSRAIVAVSKPAAAHLEETLQLKSGTVRIVPNGITPDPLKGSDVRAELGLGPATLLVLSVGNLYPVKGHEVLVRAMAKLSDRNDLPRWHMIVAGRGGEEGRLRELVHGCGLADQVTLLGLREDVADLLKAADVFVLPSFSEGLPLALLEAMFAAKPVVASAVGGIPDVVEDDRTGLLVPPGDAAALGTAIRRLMASPELRGALGAAGYAHVRSEYSADRMTGAYLQLYGQPGRLKN